MFWCASAAENLRLGTGALSAARPAFRSPLATFLVALSLIVQLFAAATPPAMAAPAFAGADDAAIAAELKALFGDTAQLCVQVNDDKAPAKHAPSGHCCDQCPLCRFAAQAVAFVSPDLPALPGSARQRGACDPRAAWPGRSSRLSRPAKSGPGPSPRSLTVVRRARLLARVRIPSDFEDPSMPTPKIRSAAGAFAGAAAALWLTPAYPHAVCGDRIFPATLAIDDPGVKTSSRCRPSVMFPSTPTAPTSGTRASAGPRRSPRASAW